MCSFHSTAWQWGSSRRCQVPTLKLDATSSQAPSRHAIFLDSRLVETHGELTNVLVPGLGDDERAPARLLRNPVVVHLPVERVAVLLPAVSRRAQKESERSCHAFHGMARNRVFFSIAPSPRKEFFSLISYSKNSHFF